jgi:hypothetical protein
MKIILLILLFFYCEFSWSEFCNKENSNDIGDIGVWYISNVELIDVKTILKKYPDFESGIYIGSKGLVTKDFGDYIFNRRLKTLSHIRVDQSMAGYMKFGENRYIREIHLTDEQFKSIVCLSNDVLLNAKNESELSIKEAEKQDAEYNKINRDWELNNKINSETINSKLKLCEINNTYTKKYLKCREAVIEKYPFNPPPSITIVEPNIDSIHTHGTIRNMYLIDGVYVYSGKLKNNKEVNLYEYIKNLFY